jgi:hypothetical protein
MPVDPSVPEPLKTALEEMEASVQAFKKQLPYLAPEVMDQHWGALQMDLANTMKTLVESMSSG